MTTPSGQKQCQSFVGGLIPASSRKTRARAEGGSKKGHSYKPLPKEFRRDGFNYRRIAREGNAAIYEQRWTGCPDPAVCFEVIHVRRHEGFRIGSRFVQPAEVYPKSDAWGVDGFTFTDWDKAWDRFVDISLEEPAMRGKEVK